MPLLSQVDEKPRSYIPSWLCAPYLDYQGGGGQLV
jgi:hypothetical protein